MKLIVVVSAAAAAHAATPKVLVFGDSWGSFGPSYKALSEMFSSRNISANVQSAAVGGTRACQWAEHGGIALAYEANKAFGTEGPDFVWYTLGGNDLVDDDYLACSKGAADYAAALECMRVETEKVSNCSVSLLDGLRKAYPAAKVVQCGYDIPCEDGECAEQQRLPFCGTNKTCANSMTVAWQDMLLSLAPHYPPGFYTGINVLGAVQQAGGVAGASVGNPVLDHGSPCALMSGCVHPTHGKAGATAVMDAFWTLYFSKQLNLSSALPRMEVAAVAEDAPLELPCTGAGYDANAAGDTSVAEARCMWQWKPS